MNKRINSVLVLGLGKVGYLVGLYFMKQGSRWLEAMLTRLLPCPLPQKKLTLRAVSIWVTLSGDTMPSFPACHIISTWVSPG